MLINRTTVFNKIKELEADIKKHKLITEEFSAYSFEHHTAKQQIAEKEVELGMLTEELKKLVEK